MPSSVRFWCNSYVSNGSGRVNDDVGIWGIVLVFGRYTYKAMARTWHDEWCIAVSIKVTSVAPGKHRTGIFAEQLFQRMYQQQLPYLIYRYDLFFRNFVMFTHMAFFFWHVVILWMVLMQLIISLHNQSIWSYTHSSLYNQWPMIQLIHTNKHNPINS